MLIKQKECTTKSVTSSGRSLGIKSHIRCELSYVNRKIESLIDGVSNGFPSKSCENMKGNLNFLQRELLAKDEFIKSLLETQTAILNLLLNSKLKSASFSSSRNCSIQDEEEVMENKADKVNIKSNNPSKSKKM